MKDMKCCVCRSPYKAREEQIKNGRGRFCSKKCWYIYLKNSKPKKGSVKACKRCGKTFYVHKSVINRKKYCSKECVKSRVEMKCKNCGKTYFTRPFLLKPIGKGVFCCKPCFVQWKKQNSSGGDNPNWKGGITPVSHSVRTSDKYFEWRKKVFNRDGHSCVICGSDKSGLIHAHHIKRFKNLVCEAILEFPLLSKIDACLSYPPLWNIDNGVTVCESCHTKIHHPKDYGKTA